jgi:hypothetical protein
MKFSTILKTGDAYEILPGATFCYNIPNQNNCLYPQLSVGLVQAVSGGTVREAAGVRVSNDLLCGPDVRLHEKGFVTISKAAVRVGANPILVPECEASKCESQHSAHGVWVPDRYSYYQGCYYASAPIVELTAPENSDLARRILMRGLAILAHGEVLDLNVLDLGPHGQGPKKVLEAFKVAFDGTNIRLDGVRTELMSQECYV